MYTSLLGENSDMKNDETSICEEDIVNNSAQLEIKNNEGEGQKQINDQISKEPIDQCEKLESEASTLVTKSPPVIMHIRTESIDETVV